MPGLVADSTGPESEADERSDGWCRGAVARRRLPRADGWSSPPQSTQREQATGAAAEAEVALVREQLRARLDAPTLTTAQEREQLRRRQAARAARAAEQQQRRSEAEAERRDEAREAAAALPPQLRVSAAASLEARAALVQTRVAQARALHVTASAGTRDEAAAFAVGVAALGAELASSEIATCALARQRATAAAHAAQLQRQLGQSEGLNNHAVLESY